MFKDPPYKVVCPILDIILLIKKYTPTELEVVHKLLKAKINLAKTPIQVASYVEFLIKYFVMHSENLEKIIGAEDEGDRRFVLQAIYDCIVELYPPFRLDIICNDINSDIFMQTVASGVATEQKELYSEYLKRSSSAGKFSAQREKLVPSGIQSLRDIKRIEKNLKKNIVGQDDAIDSVIANLKLLAAGLFKKGSFFFIGPTGVGKTQLARLLGKQFSGHFYKINCAEYAGGHEYSKLIGSPPGYVGHVEKSLLAEMAEKSKKWILLFDEIEKASPKFMNFLLSLLDDGTVTDNMGKVLDFSESIFVFTSNQGISEVKYGDQLGFSKEKQTYEKSREEIMKSVKKKFSPEFLNRIDNFIFFKSLSMDAVKKIASLEMKNIPIKKTKSLLSYIVENSYSEEYGARNIARFIKNSVAVKAADAILEGKVPTNGGRVYTPRISKSGELELIRLTKAKEELE